MASCNVLNVRVTMEWWPDSVRAVSATCQLTPHNGSRQQCTTRQLTGDRQVLEELFPYAERNVAAFEKQRTADGLQDALGWGFVDWGYVRNPGPSDMGVNLHYLAALRDMVSWTAQQSSVRTVPAPIAVSRIT